MLKYLLISLCFIILLFTLFALHLNDRAFFVEGLEVISVIGVPFLLFAFLAWGIGRALRKESTKATFQKPFRNLQLVLSGIYLIFLIVNFNLLSFMKNDAEHTQEEMNCDQSNIWMITNEDWVNDSLSSRNLMAYRSLKTTLAEVGKRPTDTMVCINGVISEHVDTIINNQRMITRIIFELTISKRPNSYYHYMYYCNDSVGFGIDIRPVAKLD